MPPVDYAKNECFVQVGASRDGLDGYMDAARRRGMVTVLLETPDYLRWRQALGRRPFDLTVAVRQPSEPDCVVAAIQGLPTPPALLLAGFERYNAAAYASARRLGVPPCNPDSGFDPPDKLAQRQILSRAKRILQPGYRIVESSNTVDGAHDLEYPLVVKPTDGGGGLGIFLVENERALTPALEALDTITNYDGGPFGGFLIEEYIRGDECSVQGIVRNGTATMLTFCEKIIGIEAHGRHRFLRSFREEAHVAVPGSEADASVRIFVQECLAAFGYLDGPFQLDLIRRGKRLFFLETGFRLSGTNLLDLVRRVTGIDWAEESMSIHLADDRRDAVMSRPPRYGGQITLRRSGQLEQAESLRAEAREADADLLIQRFSPPALPPEWQHRLPRSLDADLSRHAGALGRVIVTASSHSTVLSLLERLSRPVVMA